MVSDFKVAFVQDALAFQGGAEKVLAAALQIFPHAPIFTLVYNPEVFRGTIFENHPIFPSFLDRFPGAHRCHRAYLPLMPFALQQLDLSGFDVVITFSYAVAHAAPTRPGQLHISYIHTPMRYAWREQFIPLVSPGMGRLPHAFIQLFLGLFRRWDTAMLHRTDHFVTNSQWMARCIWKAYHRQAEVVYPPVDPDFYYGPNPPRRDGYITVSRLVRYKRLDLVVQAFSRLGLPLTIVGEGPEAARLRAMAGPNVQFLGWQPQERVVSLLAKAKAFVHAGEEDFGIALAEAQAAGCPVIALNRGAAPEIVYNGQTGLLFEEQSVDELMAAVVRFEIEGVDCPPEQIRASARRFDQQGFRRGLLKLVQEKWQAFAVEPIREFVA